MKPLIYIFSDIPNLSFVSLEDYKALQKRNERLKEQVESHQKFIYKLVDAGQIFQSGGKYAKEANLTLGSCCVVEGIKWMDEKIESLKNELKLQECDELCLRSKLYSAELRLVIAENRLDKIKEIL